MAKTADYPSTHTEAVAAKKERLELFVQIAKRLAIVQTTRETPLSLPDLISEVANDLSTSREHVAAVYWELARRGYFDLNGNPLYTLAE